MGDANMRRRRGSVTAAVLVTALAGGVLAAPAAVSTTGVPGSAGLAGPAGLSNAVVAARDWLPGGQERPAGREHPAGAGRQAGRGLPAGAAGPLSAIMGRELRGYAARRAGAGWAVRNPAQQLAARFTDAGVTVWSGRLTVRMRLAGYGYGRRLARVGAMRPVAVANRVLYRDGALTQWYANGPLGLDQGFTLARPGHTLAGRTGRLVLALAVSGATMRLAGGGLLFAAGAAAMTYRDLVVTDARGRRLPASLRVAGRRVLLLADVAGAQYPLRVDPVFAQQAKLTESAGAAHDGFGHAIAVSGNTVAIGTADATVGGHGAQGAVFVFTKPSTGWVTATQAAELTNAAGAVGDLLGTSVAIDGNTVVAGAIGVSPGGHLDQGAAYVFTEPATGWANESDPAELTASDGAAGDLLGISVGVSGGTVVAGAEGAMIGSNAGQGAVYVFTEPGAGWVSENLAVKLTASDGASHDSLGNSVAIDGGTVVAGAPLATFSGGPGAGAVYVFTKPDTGWVSENLAVKLTASDGFNGDGLGSSVAIDGGTVVAGAPDAEIGVNSSQGAVYVFTEPESGWASENRAVKLIASDGAESDRLGFTVALSDGVVAAGAPFATVGANLHQGAAYVFTEPRTGWVSGGQTVRLTAADGVAADELGLGIGVSGGTVVAGAPEATISGHVNQGAAYLFGAPPQLRLQLSGLGFPRLKQVWEPGSVLTVATAVEYPDGRRVPAWLAIELADACQVTVWAYGSQLLGIRCMEYNRSNREFVYRWRLGEHPGPATVHAQLAGSPGLSERIRIQTAGPR